MARVTRRTRLTRAHEEPMLRDREDVATDARDAIDVELEVRRAELAALERARDVLYRNLDEDCCDAHTDDSPCHGPVYSRWCRSCGEVFRRCEHHGSLLGAKSDHRAHQRAEHSRATGDPEAEDARRVSRGSPTLPLGRLQASPSARGRAAKESVHEASAMATSDENPHQQHEHQQQRKTSSSVTVRTAGDRRGVAR